MYLNRLPKFQTMNKFGRFWKFSFTKTSLDLYEQSNIVTLCALKETNTKWVGGCSATNHVVNMYIRWNILSSQLSQLVS